MRLFGLALLLVGALGQAQAPSGSALLQELQQVDQGLAGLRARIAEVSGRAEEAERARLRHADEMIIAEARLAELQALTRSHLGLLYRLERRGMARVLFSAEDPSELRRRVWYLRHLIAAEATRMAEIQKLVSSRDESKAKLTADLLEISNLRAELRVQEAELRVKRAERDAMLARARATPQLEAEVAAALDNEGQALASQLSAAAAPDERIAATRTFRGAYGKLPWPVDVAALPGSRGANRRGIDIPAAFGSPVRAVAEGRVVSAGYVKGYGETVHVEHGDYATVYGHLTGLNVRAGSAVRAGQVLGLVGDSGLGDGSAPTLSFELRYNGSPQDPLVWLRR